MNIASKCRQFVSAEGAYETTAQPRCRVRLSDALRAHSLLSALPTNPLFRAPSPGLPGVRSGIPAVLKLNQPASEGGAPLRVDDTFERDGTVTGARSPELKVGPNVKTIHFFPCTAIGVMLKISRFAGGMAPLAPPGSAPGVTFFALHNTHT